MDNKGCITCQKCEQVGINFFCGRKKLTQKQLYNKYGFCERYEPYEPKKQKEKQMTEQEYLQTCTTEQLIRFLLWYPQNVFGYPKPKMSIADEEDAIREWLKQPRTTKE